VPGISSFILRSKDYIILAPEFSRLEKPEENSNEMFNKLYNKGINLLSAPIEHPRKNMIHIFYARIYLPLHHREIKS